MEQPESGLWGVRVNVEKKESVNALYRYTNPYLPYIPSTSSGNTFYFGSLPLDGKSDEY